MGEAGVGRTCPPATLGPGFSGLSRWAGVPHPQGTRSSRHSSSLGSSLHPGLEAPPHRLLSALSPTTVHPPGAPHDPSPALLAPTLLDPLGCPHSMGRTATLQMGTALYTQPHPAATSVHILLARGPGVRHPQTACPMFEQTPPSALGIPGWVVNKGSLGVQHPTLLGQHPPRDSPGPWGPRTLGARWTVHIELSPRRSQPRHKCRNSSSSSVHSHPGCTTAPRPSFLTQPCPFLAQARAQETPPHPSPPPYPVTSLPPPPPRLPPAPLTSLPSQPLHFPLTPLTSLPPPSPHLPSAPTPSPPSQPLPSLPLPPSYSPAPLMSGSLGG
ncbi:uncharacterized protein LOC144339592 isoform X1 [Macaca mulatta]